MTDLGKMDIWDPVFNGPGVWRVIPTNIELDYRERAVMGAGLALEAARRRPDLPERYGQHLRIGKSILFLEDEGLILLPTKVSWRRPSEIEFLLLMAESMKRTADREYPNDLIVLPRLGCGHGRLNWGTVAPRLEQVFSSDRYVIVHP